jgi:hypothetical protein
MQANEAFTIDDGKIYLSQSSVIQWIYYLENKKTIGFKGVSKLEVLETSNVDTVKIKKEKWQIKLIQIIIPFFIAGLGYK